MYRSRVYLILPPVSLLFPRWRLFFTNKIKIYFVRKILLGQQQCCGSNYIEIPIQDFGPIWIRINFERKN